ncbi:MAG: hypothetical protein AAF850_00900 [Pseudomonadota bacterium]
MGAIEKALGDETPKAERPAKSNSALVALDPPSVFDLDFDALKDAGFYTPADDHSTLSLELRAIKRRLMRKTGIMQRRFSRLSAGGRAANRIMVTSTRAGEGKTFIAVNLALSLALEEKIDTLLVDGDAPRPKLAPLFNLKTDKTFSDLLADAQLPLGSAVQKANGAALSVISERVGGRAGHSTPDLLAGAGAERAMRAVGAFAAKGVAIIDAPPVLATREATILARHVDEVVFVVEADATPKDAIDAALDELLDANKRVSLVLNRTLIGGGGAHYGSYAPYGDGAPADDGGSGGV